VFTYGDATFHGSAGRLPLHAPIVGIATSPTGRGYWLAAADGGIFTYGDARFRGSAGNLPLRAPIVGIAPTPTGRGYWLAAADGGVFTYGDARFLGAPSAARGAVAFVPTPTGRGYRVVTGGGAVYGFGDAAPARLTSVPAGGVVAAAGSVSLGPTVVAVGDIASCEWTRDDDTAALANFLPGTVLSLGDQVYREGFLANYRQCYEPSWGAVRWKVRPVPGNHDVRRGTYGYHRYFGAAAGVRDRAWYSFDVGPWHVVALDAQCLPLGCTSEQVAWFRRDLADHPARCTLAYWHKPRFDSSADGTGEDPTVAPLWDAAHDAGVDVVLAGDEHFYERFAPMGPTGAVDRAHGVRLFVVGSGGARPDTFRSPPNPASEVRRPPWGVLALTLRTGGYSWRYVPTSAAQAGDTGSAACHGAP
jgi:hypothetical protein